MSRSNRDRIPNKVLREIFPKKLNSTPVSEQIYSHLKQMILSGKLRKGQRLLRWKFVQIFDVKETAVTEAFSKLKRDGLITVRHRMGSFVV
jgi:DNA-binding GntR family transcriptional regulator